MLFHTFSSQEERRSFGGSDFLELQFCRLPPQTSLERITAADSIRHWRRDSLYVSGDDDGAFVRAYGGILDCGIYGNLKTGAIDPCGINYYPAACIGPILTKLMEIRPAEYETLAAWLNQAKAHNGFYLLGV